MPRLIQTEKTLRVTLGPGDMQIAGIVLAVGAGLIWPVVEQYDPDNVKVLYLCAAAVLVGFGLMAAVAHG
jgi:hypothetical protein